MPKWIEVIFGVRVATYSSYFVLDEASGSTNGREDRP